MQQPRFSAELPPEYIKFYKYVRVSEEIFFHSIIKASPFAGRISHDYGRVDCSFGFPQSNEHGAHYVDWNERVNSPKVLTELDIQKLLDSKAIFARKFDEIVSQKLLEMLEDKISSG